MVEQYIIFKESIASWFSRENIELLLSVATLILTWLAICLAYRIGEKQIKLSKEQGKIIDKQTKLIEEQTNIIKRQNTKFGQISRSLSWIDWYFFKEDHKPNINL